MGVLIFNSALEDGIMLNKKKMFPSLSQEEIDFIWEFSFMLNKEVLKKPECFFKEKPFVEEDIFIKTKNNLKRRKIVSCL